MGWISMTKYGYRKTMNAGKSRRLRETKNNTDRFGNVREPAEWERKAESTIVPIVIIGVALLYISILILNLFR